MYAWFTVYDTNIVIELRNLFYNPGSIAQEKRNELKNLLDFLHNKHVIEGVEKYLIEEKISVEIFSNIEDERGEGRHHFKEKFKAYHQEEVSKPQDEVVK